MQIHARKKAADYGLLTQWRCCFLANFQIERGCAIFAQLRLSAMLCGCFGAGRRSQMTSPELHDMLRHLGD